MSSAALPTLIYETIQAVRAHAPGRPALIGVGGAQGSGKTTVCRLLEAANRPRFAHFSLDDVYLTRAGRAELARRIHPLFATRGPPGTHALSLATETIDALNAAGPQTRTPLPRFDKARDDRAPQSAWPLFAGQPQAILIEGWCMGATPHAGQPAPLNPLEADEDADGRWRAAIQQALTEMYQPFFARFDAIVHLQAPNWDVVRAWRGQQEEAMLGRPLTSEENAALDRFVMHYERVTRAMLAGRHSARRIAHLDEARRVVRMEERA